MSANDSELPPELTSYIDGLCDADPGGAEMRPLMITVMRVMWPAILEAVTSGINAERDECAKDMDKLASDERASEVAAGTQGHAERARIMRKAYERAASVIRARATR